jgi:hypothetical protein
MEEIKYDVFISYSRKDYMDEQNNEIPGNEISKIMQALADAGISYWIDQEGMYYGEAFTTKIIENIKASRIFLFLSTHNSNYNSVWTSREIASACEWKKCIIPVRIDPSRYSDALMTRLITLKYIRYHENPDQGRVEMINTIKEKLIAIKNQEEKDRKREEILKKQKTEELKFSISQLSTDCEDIRIKKSKTENEIRQINLQINANNQQRVRQTKELNSLKNTLVGSIIPAQNGQILNDIFISYSRKDYLDEQGNEIPNNEISKVLQSLINAGINYCIDTKGSNFGEDYINTRINDIKTSRIVLFLSTQNSNNNSAWTAAEVSIACELEKPIIPVRIDSTKYSDNILFRIADLSYINYNVNPEQGRVEMINTIKTQLAEIKRNEDIQHEQEEKRIQEEERKRNQKIKELESSIQQIDPENERLKKEKSNLLESIIDLDNTFNKKAKQHNELCQQLCKLTNSPISPLIELINDPEPIPPIPPSPLNDRDFQQFLKKWNMGAFLLSGFWCMKNNLKKEAIFVFVSFALTPLFFTLAIWLGVKIWLGFCGNSLAWKKNCSKMTPEEFISKQEQWLKLS